MVSVALTIPLYDETWARRNLAFLLDTLRPMLAAPRARSRLRSANG